MEPLERQVREWIEQRRDRLTQLLMSLVSIDTVNDGLRGNEKAGQWFLKDQLERIGMETELFAPDEASGLRDHPAYWPGKSYADRPNVVGVWRGTGASGGRSLVFSSHMDTAVVAPGWKDDPFRPRIVGDRLYGLGAFDMKGGLAASYMAIRCLKQLGVRLKGDLALESVVDEEFGGANGTVACRLRGLQADAAIIPEPTGLTVCPASRGGAFWRVSFFGHGGMPFGGETPDSPVVAAARFILFLERYMKNKSAAGGPAPWYVEDRGLPAVITRIVAGDAANDYNDAGIDTCELDVWVECYPGVTEQRLQRELQEGYAAELAEAGVALRAAPEFRKLARFLPGSQTKDPDFPLIGVLRECAERTLGRPVPVKGTPFACDSFVFNLYSDTPALVFGPAGGNAHAPDEYVELSSVTELAVIYALAAAEWCGVARHGDDSGTDTARTDTARTDTAMPCERKGSAP